MNLLTRLRSFLPVAAGGILFAIDPSWAEVLPGWLRAVIVAVLGLLSMLWNYVDANGNGRIDEEERARVTAILGSVFGQRFPDARRIVLHIMSDGLANRVRTTIGKVLRMPRQTVQVAALDADNRFLADLDAQTKSRSPWLAALLAFAIGVLAMGSGTKTAYVGVESDGDARAFAGVEELGQEASVELHGAGIALGVWEVGTTNLDLVVAGKGCAIGRVNDLVVATRCADGSRNLEAAPVDVSGFSAGEKALPVVGMKSIVDGGRVIPDGGP